MRVCTDDVADAANRGIADGDIGITGTPVIDPSTNTAFFFAKGYQDNAASGGLAKGTYK